MSDTIVELSRLVKKFGSFTAVSDLSLEVPKGEFLGLLGPNGAGKTTTIKMITGLLAPTSGNCRIAGYDVIKQSREAKRSLAYVPDQPFLYDKLTGREFLYFLGGLFDMPPADIREGIRELANAFDIGSFLDQRTAEYSLGMRQRVVLAGALMHRPSVLVIDEPLIGLDPRSARVVKETLKQKNRDGLTVIMSTHLLDIVEELCDRIAIIHRGTLVHLAGRNPETGFEGKLESLFLELTR
jgi:ABC-2 type transport system ATP-binding protein